MILMKKVVIGYVYTDGGFVNVISLNGEDIREDYQDSLMYGVGIWFENYQDMVQNIQEYLEEGEIPKFKKISC